MATKGNKMFERFLAEKNVNQSEAARRLGVPRMTIWRWLYAGIMPSHFAKEAMKARLGFEWPE